MRVLVIGTGPAGITAVETFRAHDRESPVTMVSAEPFPPYSPPAMAERFLSGRAAPLYWKGEDVAARLGATELRGARVAGIDPGARRVMMGDGRALAYDRLVLATGARLHAPVEGADLPGVHDFKSLRAASALVDRIQRGEARTALIVGAGFIGVEVALLLAGLGAGVSVVEMADRVMPRTLDAETAAIVGAAMEERGIRVRLGDAVEAFTGSREADGVRLATGEVLTADLHVAATGVRPNVSYLEGSGIEVGWGVMVDERLRTNVPEIFAAGDVAEVPDRMTGARWVHAIFPNAVAQGQIVGANLAGRELPYEGGETMNSLKHLGVPVMAVGGMEGEEVRFGRGGVLRKVFLAEGRIVGFRLAGDTSGAGFLRWLMLRRLDVARFGPALADPRFGPGRWASSSLFV